MEVVIADETLVIQTGFMVEAAKQADGALNLLTMTGSRAYGTNHEDSDYDFRGVYVASMQRLCSMSGVQDTLVDNEPNDTTVYELAHFARLAAKGNPTALEVLWGDQFLADWGGRILRDNRQLFLSKRIAKTYGGYAMSQLKRFEAGSGGSRGVEHFRRRKFKMHTLRLLLVGQRALLNGSVTVRLDELDRGMLWATSDLSDSDFAETARTLMLSLNAAEADSTLPDVPDERAINDMLYRIRKGESPHPKIGYNYTDDFE